MSSFKEGVKNILGVSVYKKLGEQVATGKISVSKAETFAFHLHDSVGGNFEIRRDTSNFRYGKEAFLQILEDWYEISTKSMRENLGEQILRILEEELDLVAVATDLKSIMLQPTGTKPKENIGKGKRKGDETCVGKQSPAKKRKGEGFTNPIFKFKEKVNDAPLGTEPSPSDQKQEPICTLHAIAKCIQKRLHDHGIDADHDEIVDSLCGLFDGDRKTRRGPKDLNSKTVKVFEKSEKTGEHRGRCFALTLGVNEQYTWNKPWPAIVSEEQKDFRTSSLDILAIGLVHLTKLGNHAVYIKNYKRSTQTVCTINSHGNQGELGPNKDGVLKETDFYAVCFVDIKMVMVYIDTVYY